MAKTKQPNRVYVAIGVAQDYSAYGTMNVRLPEGEVTAERLSEIVEEAIGKGEYKGQSLDLDVEYESGTALRITTVTIQGEMSSSIGDVYVDENAYALGYATQDFLKEKDGDGGIEKLLQKAVATKLLPPIEMVPMTGEMDFNGEIFTAEFQVRKGATQVEKDHAFMCALAQQASIEYTEAPATVVAA